MNVISVKWYNNAINQNNCIGVIKVYDEKLKVHYYYVGYGNEHSENEKQDIQNIISCGKKYTEQQVEELYNKFFNIKE